MHQLTGVDHPTLDAAIFAGQIRTQLTKRP
jgi:hypothetical protein